MNIVKDVAKLLGIEVGVPFHVNEEKIIYRFDEDGAFSWKCDDGYWYGAFSWKCDDGYWSRDLVLTSHFLRGILTVKWKPKEGEKYYTVDPTFASGVYPLIWGEESVTAKTLYDRGLVFHTEEEAAAKAKEYGWIK